MITHDLGVVADMADRVLVMYAGRVVEYGTVDEVFYQPLHPYTWGLMDSIPRARHDREGRAVPDQGSAARASINVPRGLRVPSAVPVRAGASAGLRCPSSATVDGTHWRACHFAGDAGIHACRDWRARG